MKIADIIIKRHKSNDSKAKHQKRIKNHRKAAKHLRAASKFHLEAATHHKGENLQKAIQSTIAAHGQVTLSNEVQRA